MGKETYGIRVVRRSAGNRVGVEHVHVVTEIHECLCGCRQEELFPLDLADTPPAGSPEAWAAAGRRARAALGYLSRDRP